MSVAIFAVGSALLLLVVVVWADLAARSALDGSVAQAVLYAAIGGLPIITGTVTLWLARRRRARLATILLALGIGTAVASLPGLLLGWVAGFTVP